MKERYWLYLLVAVVVAGLSGKVLYTSIRQSQENFRVAADENRKMAELAKEAANIRLHAKKRPVIELPYCVEYNITDINAASEPMLREVVRNCFFSLMKSRDYKTLDLMIASIRDKKLRTPSGLWLQSFFYQSAKQYLDFAASDKDFDRMDAELQAWLAESKDSDAAKLILADSMLKRAWLYRGSGFSNTVSPENSVKFHAQLAKTKKYLLANEDISTRDPKWFSEILDVINLEKDASALEHRNYFDKAVALYPGYYPIYYSASVFYYRKWHGVGLDSFDNFLRYALKKLPQQEAKVMYARIYWSSVCSECGDAGAREWVNHWEQIAQGFDQLVTDYPEYGNLNSYGWLACSAGDKKRTLALLNRLKQNIDYPIWQEPFTYSYCVKMADLLEENDKAKKRVLAAMRQ